MQEGNIAYFHEILFLNAMEVLIISVPVDGSDPKTDGKAYIR